MTEGSGTEHAHGRAERTHRHRRRPWLIALVAVVAVVLLAVGAGAVYAWNLGNTFDTKTHKIAKAFPTEAARPVKPTQGPAAQAQNILLMGSDTHGSDNESLDNISGQRSDVIMVVHIPADRQHIYVMSILRDSWVPIPGHDSAKVNAALSWGGVPLAVQTVESLIGVRIDHVALVDFDAFKGLTDALGGVTIDNPIAFSVSTTNGETFPIGPQRLDGDQALAYVRERHAFPTGDFQRVKDQQVFLAAVLKSVLSSGTLTNPGKVSALIGTVSPYLAVDSGLNSDYLAGLALQLRDIRTEDVVFFDEPTLGTGTSADGQSTVIVDWNKLSVLQRAFQSDTLNTYQP